MTKLKKNSGISEKKRDALVLIDVINDFDFPGAEALLPCALSQPNTSPRSRKARVPAIYANDISGYGVRIFASKLSTV